MMVGKLIKEGEIYFPPRNVQNNVNPITAGYIGRSCNISITWEEPFDRFSRTLPEAKPGEDQVICYVAAIIKKKG